jgi:hypothetical protein
MKEYKSTIKKFLCALFIIGGGVTNFAETKS